MTYYLGWSTHEMTAADWQLMARLLDERTVHYRGRRNGDGTWYAPSDRPPPAVSQLDEKRIVSVEYWPSREGMTVMLTRRGERFARQLLPEIARAGVLGRELERRYLPEGVE